MPSVNIYISELDYLELAKIAEATRVDCKVSELAQIAVQEFLKANRQKKEAKQ